MAESHSVVVSAEGLTRRPAAISFDFYGTLMQTKESAAASFARILRWNGASTTDQAAFQARWQRICQDLQLGPYLKYREICHLALEHTFHEFGIAGRARDIEHYFEGYAKLRPWPDSEPVLQRLAEVYPLAVVTNCDVDLFWQTPHPDVPFRHYLIAENARGYKADGTLFRFALREMGIHAQDLLQAGQSQRTDLIGAKPLGIVCAWINRHSLRRDADVPEPDFEFSDLQPLLDTVDLADRR